MSIKSISKSISSTKVHPQMKLNNYVKPKSVISQLHFIIIFESIQGINRLHLMNVKKIGLVMSKMYSLLLLSFSLYFASRPQPDLSSTFVIVKYVNILELTILVISSSFGQKKTLTDLFRNLDDVDKIINPTDSSILTPTANGIRWLIISTLYGMMEYVAFLVTLGADFEPVHIIMYIALSSHNCEQIFFGTLLRAVNTRLLVLKEHVVKVLRVDDHADGVNKDLSPTERLARTCDLDVSALHKLYEKLHTCSENLNSVIGFPMLVMLVSSGMSTTLMAMTIINLFQMPDMNEMAVLYCSIRCILYTALVLIPCYYCGLTQEQVQIIQTVLHDAINIGELETLKRRKVKAFLQLARDSEFTYALWGIINMNMSLPLSYLSICTTYLVIIIQFSKFLD